jgi:hypothetical protein
VGKSSRRKKQRCESRQSPPLGLDLRVFNNPLFGIPPGKRSQAFKEIGAKQAGLFVSTTAKIVELIGRTNLVHLLACLASYGIPDFMDDTGAILEKKKAKLFPAHVEMTQVVAVSVVPGSASREFASITDIQFMFETLPEWADQFHWKRLAQLEKAANETERGRLAVQEQMRSGTQMIRNWGFYAQVKRIATDVLSPLDDRFEEARGYRITDLVPIFDHMFHEAQRRLVAHWDALKQAMLAKTVPAAVIAYYESNAELNDSREEFQGLMLARRASLEMTKTMIMSHSDLRLPDCDSFEATSIAKAIGRPVASVEAALGAMSYQLGDLHNSNIEHAFMDNAIWTQPAIRMASGRYFCPPPQTFFAFPFETVLRLIESEKSLRDAYDKRRSDYLEGQTQAIFKSASVIANFKWHSPDKTQQFETDLLVIVDSVILIIEAKSGRVSPQSRRGAPDSLREDIRDLLIEPSRQSKRLEGSSHFPCNNIR